MAKSTVGTYKHTVWKSCADYIKLRDADCLGMVNCCTCSKKMHYKSEECNAGHFVPGRGNTVLFDDAHIFCQCVACNMTGSGEQYKFGCFLKDKYGYNDDQLEDILNMRHQIKKYSMEQLKEIKKRFDDDSNRLRKEKGLI